MGNAENTESRMNAAIARLQAAADKISTDQPQASFDMVGGGSDAGLTEENSALKRELGELQAKYDALKRTADIVSTRLDNSIDELSAILEQ